MFIEPIQSINSISDINQINSVKAPTDQNGLQVPFKSVFDDALDQVISADKQVNIDAEMLATGQSDNLHQYGLDISKAQLSLDLLVELRNKALDAYSEVMRMSV